MELTHYGQVAGNSGMNMVLLVPSLEEHCSASPPPTPLSPDENKMEVPRAPRVAKPEQTRVA